MGSCPDAGSAIHVFFAVSYKGEARTGTIMLTPVSVVPSTCDTRLVKHRDPEVVRLQSFPGPFL